MKTQPGRIFLPVDLKKVHSFSKNVVTSLDLFWQKPSKPSKYLKKRPDLPLESEPRSLGRLLGSPILPF